MPRPVICPICRSNMKVITINKHGNVLYAVHSDDNINCSHGTDFMYESAEAAIQAWNVMAAGLPVMGVVM